MRSYILHLTFWNGHALIMFMQYILGTEFLPQSSWAPLSLVTGPIVALLAAVSLYFLARFAAQLAGRDLPRVFAVLYPVLWTGLVLFFALKAGDGTSAPDRILRFYSLSFFILKTGTVLITMGYLLSRAVKVGAPGERRALRSVAWVYIAGFFLFQLSVSGPISLHGLPAHDYLVALFQIGFHFPVLAALDLYSRRRAAARPTIPFPQDAPRRLLEMGVSPREAEIIGLVMRGFSNKEIEHELFISLETVKKHLSSIYRKLGVKGRLQLSLLIQKKP